MKKILKIIGAVLVILITIIGVLPMMFKDSVIQLVKEEANNYLNAQVDFGEFDLSIISTFPDFYFSINDVKVEGVEKFEGTTLAAIGSLEIKLDVMSVVGGKQFKIKTISISDVNVNAIVLKDSLANWDIAIAAEENSVSKESESTEETKFNLALEHYEFKNINVVYEDASANMSAKIVNFNHEGNGDFTQDVFLLNTVTSIQEITYKMDGIQYVNKANIAIDFDAEIDNLNAKYTFKENSFRINELELGLDGWLAMPADDIEMDLAFHTNKPSFKSLLSLVPAIYLTDFQDIQTKGNVAFSGNAKGTYTEELLPSFNVDLLVENAMFKYPDLPKSVDNVQIKVNAQNPGGIDDQTVVDISQFHLEMGDNPVDIVMKMKTLVSDPDMKGKIIAQINMDNMGEFIPAEEGEQYSGNVTANVELEGKMSTLDNEDYENFNMKGDVIILDMKYGSEEMDYDVDIKELYMNFSPQYVQLSSFDAEVGESDFSGSGRVENFLAYTFRDEPLKGELNLNSNYINVNEFLTEEDSTSTTETTDQIDGDVEEGTLKVPANIDFVMAMNVKKMLYDDISIENMKGGIMVRNEQAILDDLSMNMMGGSLVMKGKFDTQFEQPQVEFNYDIKYFDIPTMYKTFNTVKEIAPIAENATGSMSTNLDFKCKLDEKMEIDTESLTGNGVLHTHQIEINNSETLSKLADALQQPKYKKLTLNENKIFYEFKDGRVNVEPFDLKIGNTKVNTGGSQGFDESMNYTMKMDIPAGEFGAQAGALLTGLLAQNPLGSNAKMPERIKLDVLIGGTVSNPKITTNLLGGSGTVKEQAVEQVKEVAKEKVEEVIEDTKAKAKEQADKIMADARKQAEQVKSEAKKAAEKVKSEGYKQADDLIKKGGSPLEKIAAKAAAEKLKQETDKKHAQMISEGDNQARKIIDTAQKKADDLLK